MLTINATKIILKSLRITASQELATEDASGQSSPFTDKQQLTNLFKLAEATESGARVIYRISNKTAEALGVKQVRFASKIEAVEQQTTRQWSVSFTLQEYRSVPQKVEERQPDAVANQQGANTNGESGFEYASLQQNLTDNFGTLRS